MTASAEKSELAQTLAHARCSHVQTCWSEVIILSTAEDIASKVHSNGKRTITRATDQGPVSFQVSGMSTRRGTPLGAPCNAYDSADHAITCTCTQNHVILDAIPLPSLLCCI